jgi:hypothetical protein
MAYLFQGVGQMTDLAEIDSFYKALKLPRRSGRPPWRATDELTRPDEAAVRRAAFYVEVIKAADKGSRNGRHERAIEQAIEYMKEKGFHLPNRESLEYFLRRSKRKPKPSNMC